jgi:hypothetical protein
VCYLIGSFKTERDEKKRVFIFGKKWEKSGKKRYYSD